jgi:hypothetical protein
MRTTDDVINARKRRIENAAKRTDKPSPWLDPVNENNESKLDIQAGRLMGWVDKVKRALLFQSDSDGLVTLTPIIWVVLAAILCIKLFLIVSM